MKQGFRLFHFPVFIAVLVGMALALILHFSQPRDSLLDYALTLQDGQFICETGKIYEAVADYPASDRIYARCIGDANGDFVVNFGSTPAENLLPHEFAMQMTVYGSIFIDNSGNVWHDTHEVCNGENALLVQYLTPAAVLDRSDVVEINIFGGSLKQDYRHDAVGIKQEVFTYYPISLTYSILHSSSSADRYNDDLAVEFSVKLKNGWYAITSQHYDHTIYLPNVSLDTTAEAKGFLTVYDAAISTAYACCEFDMHIKDNRIHVSDKSPQTYELR